MGVIENPFDVTKATDYEDKEIEPNFVSFAVAGATSLVSPADPMPTFLIGGKGGGRTHLLRHFAFAQQKERARANECSTVSQLQEEGYIGVYVRFTGLNSNRFQGKGVPRDAWQAVFAYYVDLWLAQTLIRELNDIQSANGQWSNEEQDAFVEEFESGFDLPRSAAMFELLGFAGPLDATLELITEELRGFDQAMNWAAIERKLDVQIRSAPGRVVFAASRAVTKLSGGEALRVTFMLDEFENLEEWQQEYVNTLIRDKELPTTFLVGSRRWGIKTRRTWSAGEENKLGSEFDQIVLEDAYRERKAEYERFCREIVLKRLQRYGDWSSSDRLAQWFGEPDHLKSNATDIALRYMRRFSPQNRPHLARLRDLIPNKSDAIAIAKHLAIVEDPILEKLAVREFYGEWKKRGAPRAVDAAELGMAFRSYSAGGSNPRLQTLEAHWRADMLAQIIDSTRADQVYAGFDQYVQMSGFLPRSLLVVVKNITAWSIRYGENPFDGEVLSISRKAMITGVREAAHWFIKDASPEGQLGLDCEVAIRRLGSLFRSQRFSDRPAEVACSAFSFSPAGVSREAMNVLTACADHALLIEVPSGRRERNTAESLRLYQLNPMLAPMFDLATSRRGTMPFTASDINSLFDPISSPDSYRDLVTAKTARMNAPFGRGRDEHQLERTDALF